MSRLISKTSFLNVVLLRSRWMRVTFVLMLSVLTVVCVVYAVMVRQESHHATQQAHAATQQSMDAHNELSKMFGNLIYIANRENRPISIMELELLHKHAEFQVAFVKNSADNDDLQPHRARTYLLLGQFYMLIGEPNKAEAAYRSAQDLFARLQTQHGGPVHQFNHAVTTNCLCYLLADVGKYTAAKKAAATARAQLESLCEHGFPNPMVERRSIVELAISLRNSGMLALVADDVVQADKDLRRSIGLLSDVLTDSPANIGILEHLIDTQQVLGVVMQKEHRLDAAKKLYTDSVELLELLDHVRVDSPHFELKHANADIYIHNNLAQLNKALATAPRFSSHRDTTNTPRVHWRWRAFTAHDQKTIPFDIIIRGRLPAEFETHDALMLSFNWRDSIWWSEVLPRIVSACHAQTQVLVFVPDHRAQRMLHRRFTTAKVDMKNVRFFVHPTDSVWIRDYGPWHIRTPTFGPLLVDARYSRSRPGDDHTPRTLARTLTQGNVHISLPLEGGNLLCNGKGLCLSTTKLLQLSGKLGYSKIHVTNTIKRFTGARQVIYLEPLAEESTGHVDMFATFTAPNTVVVGDYRGLDPKNTAILDRNAARLKKVTTPSGPLRVVRIPMGPHGERNFTASYTNVVYVNRTVLVPTYSHVAKRLQTEVMDTYRRLLPGWNVVAVDATTIGQRHGSLRCATMPLLRLPKDNDGLSNH